MLTDASLTVGASCLTVVSLSWAASVYDRWGESANDLLVAVFLIPAYEDIYLFCCWLFIGSVAAFRRFLAKLFAGYIYFSLALQEAF